MPAESEARCRSRGAWLGTGGSVISTAPPGPELILKLDVEYWPTKLICATVTSTNGRPKRPLVTVSTPLFAPVDV